MGIINTHVNSREGVLVHVPNQTLLDDIVVNKSMRDFRPIEESIYLIPSSVPDLPKLIQEIQERLESLEGLLQEDDIRRLIRLRGGRIKLFRPLCMFDGYCNLGLELKIYAFARGSLSRRGFAALKSEVLLLVHDFLTSRGVEIGHLSTISDKRRGEGGEETQENSS